MSFKIKDDLYLLRFDWHNQIHFFGSMIIAGLLTYHITAVMLQTLGSLVWISLFSGIFIGFSCAWVMWILWDVGDGFKPHWRQGIGKPWIIQQLFYSDYCSMQDVFVWDLFGSLVGSIIGILIFAGMNIH